MNRILLTILAVQALATSPALAAEAGPVDEPALAATISPSVSNDPMPVAPAADPAPLAAAAVAEPDDELDEDEQDDAAIEQQVQEESRALQDLHEAEVKARLLEDLTSGKEAAAAASRLGWESPLRQRLGDAFRRELGGARDAGAPIAGLPEIDHDLRRLQAEYDIPIEVNPAVVAYVRFFQSSRVRSHFLRWLARSHRYIPRYREIMKEEGLPEDTVYLAMIESGFANLATSRAKAVGPWQFIPATGKRFGLDQDFWIDERRDPEKAARAAARYLKELHHQTGDWRLAWAGYNAGVGKIYKARKKGQLDFWTMARGNVLKAETKGYVPKLMAAAIVAKHPEAFGFSKEEIVAERWSEYDEVVVPRATELSFIAEAAGVPEKAILELNPELRRTCTPPRAYEIKIPKGQRETFAKNWTQVSERAARNGVARHKVIKGETIVAIGGAYGVAPGALAKLNGLKPGRRVKPGTVLVVPLGSLARRDAAAVVAAAAIEEPPARPAKVHGKAAAKKAAQTVVAKKQLREPVRSSVRASVRVRTGDSLWSVAKRFGVAVDELARWNGIRNPKRYTLRAGQKLYVEARPAVATATRTAKTAVR
jgi:membrane-bound lytic murein transglycosylase D